MKKQTLVVGLLLVAGLVIISAIIYLNKKTPITTTDQYLGGTADSCSCQSSWFPHAKTPAPAEGKGSPFDVSSTTNCIFHQWSWQKFLWVTKPLPSGRPLFMDSLDLVTSAMEPVAPQLGQNFVLSAIGQAGFEANLLSNAKFNNRADTVYYSIHVNGILKDKAVLSAAALHNGTMPYSNLEAFPVGSLELKVSWINADAIPAAQRGTYYTTTAAVLDKNNQYKVRTMALLGMHVVGVVQNHPEFIWATFEHKDMAPTYNWASNSATATNEMLLSEKGTTTDLGAITWDKGNSKPAIANKAYALFEFGVPRVLGSNAFMKTSQSEPANFNNVRAIDRCVVANLDDVFKNYFYNGSIWLNTDGLTPQQQATAIVTRNISSALPDSMARGSVNLANLTMETYTQSFQHNIKDISASNLVNCFTCHQAKNFDKTLNGAKSPLYLSHVFESYMYNTKPAPRQADANAKSKRIDEIRGLKRQQLEEFIRAMK